MADSLQRLPRLALTLGDPTGIGPEVILKALANPQWSQCCELTVVGHADVLLRCYEQLAPLCPGCLCHPEQLNIVDIGNPIADKLGQPSVASGAASFAYVNRALDGVVAGAFDGVVTGPIAKTWWQQAGHHYAGQTELCAQRANASRFGMLFVAESPHSQWPLRCLLATTHIPLAQVPHQLTPALMTTKLELLIQCLAQDFGLPEPIINVAGLNPHSGEQGQLGHEELEWLIPWLADMCDRNPQLTLQGPIPPDTMWVQPGQAWFGSRPNPSTADAYLALYHDQGLIPVKLMAFDRAVNTTIGLPFVRTSPDHGTAFDIAGQGIADPTSMAAAIRWAIYFVNQRYQL